MSTLRKIVIAAAILILAPATCAWALETDDVIRMVKAKAGDEVIVAQMKAAKARFVLTADDIVRLKKEGVSDAVIKAMIETVKSEPAPKAAEPKESAPAAEARPASETSETRRPAEKPAPVRERPATKEPAPAREAAPAEEPATFVIENLDSREYSVQVDAERRNVFFYKASAVEWREPLPARGSQIWRLPAGAYRLTWVGGSESHTVKLLSGKESRATLTRTSGEGFEALYLSLFEDGERRGGGRLVVLADRAPAASEPVAAAPAPAPAPVQTQTVIAAPPVVERYYYTTPTYVAPVYAPGPVYCGYPRYGHGCSYGHGYGYYGLGLFGRVSIPLGHHGRLGIGFGF